MQSKILNAFISIFVLTSLLVLHSNDASAQSTAKVTVKVQMDIANASPLEGAKVICRKKNPRYHSKSSTNQNGRTECSQVPVTDSPYRLNIIVSRRRFRSKSIQLGITPGKTSYTVNLKLKPTKCTITGIVKSKQNKPLSGATVVTTWTSTQTDSNGKFEFKNISLSKNSVKVKAMESGYVTSDFRTVQLDDDHLTFSAGTIKLQRKIGAISGKVVGGKARKKETRPLSGAKISCGGKRTGSGQDGKFMLHHINSGSRTLKVRMRGYKDKTLNVTVPVGTTKNLGTIRLTKIPSKRKRRKKRSSQR